jgi:hypothetical protein
VLHQERVQEKHVAGDGITAWALADSATSGSSSDDYF